MDIQHGYNIPWCRTSHSKIVSRSLRERLCFNNVCFKNLWSNDCWAKERWNWANSSVPAPGLRTVWPGTLVGFLNSNFLKFHFGWRRSCLNLNCSEESQNKSHRLKSLCGGTIWKFAVSFFYLRSLNFFFCKVWNFEAMPMPTWQKTDWVQCLFPFL